MIIGAPLRRRPRGIALAPPAPPGKRGQHILSLLRTGLYAVERALRYHQTREHNRNPSRPATPRPSRAYESEICRRGDDFCLPPARIYPLRLGLPHCAGHVLRRLVLFRAVGLRADPRLCRARRALAAVLSRPRGADRAPAPGDLCAAARRSAAAGRARPKSRRGQLYCVLCTQGAHARRLGS